MCLDDYDFPLLARDDGGGAAQRGAFRRHVEGWRDTDQGSDGALG